MTVFRQSQNKPSRGTATLIISIVLCLANAHVVNAEEGDKDASDGWMDYWFIRLGLNVLGYLSVVVPAWLVISYIRRSGYLEKGGEDPEGTGIRVGLSTYTMYCTSTRERGDEDFTGTGNRVGFKYWYI